jgi:hypothetical protein
MWPHPVEVIILAWLVTWLVVFRLFGWAVRKGTVADCFERIRVGMTRRQVEELLKKAGFQFAGMSSGEGVVRAGYSLLAGGDVLVIEYRADDVVRDKAVQAEGREAFLVGLWRRLTGR